MLGARFRECEEGRHLMAGEGVKLVERLRLGEPPESPDWELASAILGLRDACTAYVAAAADLVDDRAKAASRQRFEVRARLLSRAAARIRLGAADVRSGLGSYFAVRAEEEAPDFGSMSEDSDGGEGDGDAGDGGVHDGGADGAPGSDVETELGAVFAAGGLAEPDAEVLGRAGEQIRSDAAWLATAVTGLIMEAPDHDSALDFCSEVESRFVDETFEVEEYFAGSVAGNLAGKGFSEALDAALEVLIR